MVALDDEGRPDAVPAVRPETAVGERRAREAQVRRDSRLAERERIEAGRDDQTAIAPVRAEPGPSRKTVSPGGASSDGS